METEQDALAWAKLNGIAMTHAANGILHTVNAYAPHGKWFAYARKHYVVLWHDFAAPDWPSIGTKLLSDCELAACPAEDCPWCRHEHR